jgi:FSR family fosmidomycin resistance protein-like MFS transporter
VNGLRYLRFSAALTLPLFCAFLLLPTFGWKVGALALMGLLNAGWYAILKGQLYSSMPGRSGTVMAVSTIFFIGAFVPVIFGAIAEQVGLGTMMWLMILGPVALLVGIPRARAAMNAAK